VRVLYWMPRGSSVPGGHIIQLTKTADYVARHGILTDVSYDTKITSTNYDIVHGFGLNSSEVYAAKLLGAKVVQSPIYWDQSYDCYADVVDPPYLLQHGARSLRRLLGKMKRRLFKQSVMSHNHQEFLNTLRLLDAILPNSTLEYQAIERDMGVGFRSFVVPNAVDVEVFYDRGNSREPSVLCCGRIEPHKNQLSLIYALKDTEIPLTIVGMPHPDHPQYVETVLSKCVGKVKYAGGFDQSGLVGMYNSHSVHIVPSWFETTGLVTLEAALCGCNVVSTSRGYASEYFGSMAEYCEPSSLKSIRESVVRSLNKVPKQELVDRIRKNYSWTATAKATIACYQELS
jgi:glycosyltransferase involved in cell wall biosynthesis